MTSEWSVVPIIGKCERKRKSLHHKVCYPFDHFRVVATYITHGCSNCWFQTHLMYLLYFSLEMWTSVSLASYLINTVTLHTPVMKMRTVQTPKAHSSARVIQDILEMESRVLVITLISNALPHLALLTSLHTFAWTLGVCKALVRTNIPSIARY